MSSERQKSLNASVTLIATMEMLVALAATSNAAAQTTPALEEIIVTATRGETDLQQTPMSIQAFTSEKLQLAGIENGRDLGIMVPNVVLNADSFSEAGTSLIIRGMPGVKTYFDGFTTDLGVGFLQRTFVELERVEVLRGPQGTLFGRSTNGGAVQLITRMPGDEFEARLGIDLGSFDRRTVRLALDVPINERILSKWTLASDRNDGFLDSQMAPISLGEQRDSLIRGDILWSPTEDFSLRVTVNEEKRRGTQARVVRVSNPEHPLIVAYNVLAGNPDYLAQARAIDPGFPDPPFALAGDRFTGETHEPGYPGGTLDKWQTRSDIAGPTVVVTDRFLNLTMDWQIGDRWSMRSMTQYLETPDAISIGDNDASEFFMNTSAFTSDWASSSQELHVTGTHFGGRLETFLGAWYFRRKEWSRFYFWRGWEFSDQSIGPGPPGQNAAAVDYVRSWGTTVGNAALAAFNPPTLFSGDLLLRFQWQEKAVFGQVKIGLLERLDLNVGFRFSSDIDNSAALHAPADAFRSSQPGALAAGDPFLSAGVINTPANAESGTVSTPRISINYQPTDNLFLYASYAEGFTEADFASRACLPEPVLLDPEVVRTREIGMRSQWFGGRLRFNGTYFDSRWNGLRVNKRYSDPNAPNPCFAPSSVGLAESSGFELDLAFLPGERWELDLAVGLLDTAYIDIGDPDPFGTGIQPGTPFAYAPDLSYSFGVRYRLPIRGGGELLFAGDYGWMDEYERNSEAQSQRRNPDGSPQLEPSYGVLSARIVYAPARANWRLSVYGTNLTDEWYVDGGTDAGLSQGIDIATIGRPREVGVGVQFTFD